MTNEQLATFIRQKIAIDFTLPLALWRLEQNIDDDTELYEGQLQARRIPPHPNRRQDPPGRHDLVHPHPGAAVLLGSHFR